MLMENVTLHITENDTETIPLSDNIICDIFLQVDNEIKDFAIDSHSDSFSPRRDNSDDISKNCPFTSTIFSCCDIEWRKEENKERVKKSPLFTPKTIPPQNMIIDSNYLHI